MKRILLSGILVSGLFSPFVNDGWAEGKYWIFFKGKPNAQEYLDKSGVGGAEQYLLEHGYLTKRAINRRLKVLPLSRVVSQADFPVYQPYLDSLRSAGLDVVGESRWFNAAVVETDSSHLVRAERLPFVMAMRHIPVFSIPVGPETPTAAPPRLFKVSSSTQPGDSSFYGPSYSQLNLSRIPEVQALGINGQGVLVGMLDTGFRYNAHDALAHVRIVGEHDFIQHDSLTRNQPNNNPPDAQDQDNHGTSTLSVLGGYAPGDLIGVAYGADFMLAKTEYVPVTDFKWEEDNWVEGIEWMEARGVDVVSSSVAYSIFVDSSGAVDSAQSYFWSRGDFNGRTALCSRAATRAAELGVVVVQAMGNEGNGNGVVGTMDTPADADSIISVGAVDLTGKLAYFSSTGPTNDGRTKPDLVADGVGDYVAVVPGPDTYAYESGTSFSTPITAGIAAMILNVRPNFTPMQVIDLLKRTAVENMSAAGSDTLLYPNDFYGWGIVNAWNAMNALGFVSPNDFSNWSVDSVSYVATRAYSTNGINVSLSKAFYSFDGVNYFSAPVFTTDSLNQYAFRIPSPKSLTSQVYFYFDFQDSAGKSLDVPYDGAKKPFAATGWKLYPVTSEQSFVMFDAYPNPFNTGTHISFVLRNSSAVNIEVYDVLGRKVKTVFSGTLPSGYQEFVWNGDRGNGEQVASGIYLVKVQVNGAVKVVKSLFLK